MILTERSTQDIAEMIAEVRGELAHDGLADLFGPDARQWYEGSLAGLELAARKVDREHIAMMNNPARSPWQDGFYEALRWRVGYPSDPSTWG